MVCGATAGLVATMLLHPLDLIKTRFHVQEHGSKRLPHYGGVLDACRSITARSDEVAQDAARTATTAASISPDLMPLSSAWDPLS